MHATLARLLEKGPVVCDGAWGTELQRRGLAPGRTPDLWNVERPDAVRAVAESYVAAGSRIILTNTFRSNRIALADSSGPQAILALNAAGVAISKSAAAGRAAVFASIGPSGKLLMTGDVTALDLEMAFAEQAGALAAAGADALLIETMTDLEEAVLALRAARASGLPVVVSMVFDSGEDKDRTMMGLSPEEVAQALTEAGADAVGANCGLGVQGYISVCRRMRASTDLPLWMKPNAGLPELVDGQIVYRTTPQAFASGAVALRQAGGSFIGGCCGTSPEFIRAVVGALAVEPSR